MDKNFIEAIIFDNGRDDRLIKRGDFLDKNIVKMLCNAKPSKVPKAFYMYDDKERHPEPYKIEITCSKCGKEHVKELNKTKVIEALRCIQIGEDKYGVSWCDDCTKKEKEIREFEREASERENRIFVLKQKEEYLKYLDPRFKFNDGFPAKLKISTIMNAPYVIDNYFIKSHICALNYKEFLDTPYWDGVRCYKLQKANYKCQLCGKTGKLNVHHRTYENHGMEHVKKVADSDLIVLCEDCHRKFHNIIQDKEV